MTRTTTELGVILISKRLYPKHPQVLCPDGIVRSFILRQYQPIPKRTYGRVTLFVAAKGINTSVTGYTHEFDQREIPRFNPDPRGKNGHLFDSLMPDSTTSPISFRETGPAIPTDDQTDT